MNILNNTINRITFLTGEVPQTLKNYTEDEQSLNPAPGKWSKKEILGHLCDSAINNLTRFINAQIEPEPFKVKGYHQNEWVIANNYREMKSNDIINLWTVLNKQINKVIAAIPPDKLQVECEMSETSFRPVGNDRSLLWLIEDYLLHMEHHLRQLGIKN